MFLAKIWAFLFNGHNIGKVFFSFESGLLCFSIFKFDIILNAKYLIVELCYLPLHYFNLMTCFKILLSFFLEAVVDFFKFCDLSALTISNYTHFVLLDYLIIILEFIIFCLELLHLFFSFETKSMLVFSVALSSFFLFVSKLQFVILLSDGILQSLDLLLEVFELPDQLMFNTSKLLFELFIVPLHLGQVVFYYCLLLLNHCSLCLYNDSFSLMRLCFCVGRSHYLVSITEESKYAHLEAFLILQQHEPTHIVYQLFLCLVQLLALHVLDEWRLHRVHLNLASKCLKSWNVLNCHEVWSCKCFLSSWELALGHLDRESLCPVLVCLAGGSVLSYWITSRVMVICISHADVLINCFARRNWLNNELLLHCGIIVDRSPGRVIWKDRLWLIARYQLCIVISWTRSWAMWLGHHWIWCEEVYMRLILVVVIICCVPVVDSVKLDSLRSTQLIWAKLLPSHPWIKCLML